MRSVTLACTGLVVLVACATAGQDDAAAPPGHTNTDGDAEDSGAPIADAGPDDADAPSAPDAERPLACGPTGMCETRLPTSDLGEPLSLRGVWVVASNDVWSVSAQGLIVHYDGTTWTTSHRANRALYSIWGTATDVWAGGEQGLLLHRSAGGSWTRVETGHLQPIRSIYGNSPSDVWFTGRLGDLDHFDGAKLTSFSTGRPDLHITTIFGRPGFEVYAAGYVEGQMNDWAVFQDEPYIFELSSTGISPFNTSLTNNLAFVPVAGVAINATNDAPRVALFGYEHHYGMFISRYSAFGRDTPAVIDYTMEPPVGAAPGQEPPLLLPPPTHLAWGNAWNDIRIMQTVDRIVRWDGTAFKRQPINMGYSFIPRPVFGIHGNSENMWIVGDGFALKGATQ